MATNNFATQSLTLGTAVANGATFTVGYPAGSVQADFTGVYVNTADEAMIVNDNDRYDGTKVDFAYGASLVTVTNNTGGSLPAGSRILLNLAKANRGAYTGIKAPAITDLTAATGTASDTIADVSGAFVQATLNNNFKSLAAKYSALLAAVKAAGIVA